MDRRPDKRYPPVKKLTDAQRIHVVKDIFSTVTGKYDFLNRFLSLRRDVSWRRAAVARMRFFRTHRLLDVATGTCDLALEAVRRHPGLRVVGLDLVREMMEVGRRKIDKRGASTQIQLVTGDALRLPFAAGQFDAVSVAFGIRNMPDRLGALREMARVLVPGGALLVLEMGLPRIPLLKRLYRSYLNAVLPRLARRFTSNPDAYRYLVDSIQDFPDPDAFSRLMQAAGLEKLAVVPLTLGATYIHIGHTPVERNPVGRTAGR